MRDTSAIFCVGSIESVTGWSGAHSDDPSSAVPATIPGAKHKTGTKPECFDVSEGEAVFQIKQSPRFQFADGPRFEIKADSSGRISGYGSFFGNVDLAGDRVLPGAFAKSLADHKNRGFKLKMLWQHRADTPIGVWHNAREDGRGLFVEGVVNLKTDAGRNAYEHIAAGDVDSLSIGYREVKAVRGSDGSRDLVELEVYEVSPVTFPANQSATITAAKSDIEKILQAGGLSKQAAKLVAAGGWKELSKSFQPDLDAVARFSALIDEANSKLKEI